MSWHLPHRFYRLTTVHRAVSIALLYSVSSVALSTGAQAATIGKTVITSAQHQPLAASIIVTDIQSADFSASLANSVVYQQMGLTPTASMTVRFEPTSSTAGQLFISTTQPVSKPFTDVVLAINDGGQRKVIPKTLLMPLDDNDSLPSKPSNTVITGVPKPNLPVISANNTRPLTLREGTPPSLSTFGAQESTQAIMPTPQVGNFVDAPSNGTRANGGTDKQLDILNIQVTRQIQPSNTANNSVMANPPITVSTPKNNTKPIFELIIDDSNVPNSNSVSNGVVKQTAPSKTRVNPSTNAATDNTGGSAANYTVQRNDNLWIISQQIAEQNNLNIQAVMTQIQSQNPGAFIDQDANQLKANTQLSLPNYDVVPSQQSLQAAISAQRKHTQQASKPVTKKVAPKASSETTQASNQTSKAPEKPAKTTTQTLPKARFSVLAPGRDGSADGTQTKSAAATGNGLSTDILATLKSSRQRTAAQAKRLTKTNSTLSSYTKKLQLQNQKLAELQARLKKLRNQ